MAAPVPTPDDLAGLAARYGFDLSAADRESFAGLITATMASYEVVDGLAAAAGGGRAGASLSKRDGGAAPTEGENRLGAWYRRCSIVDDAATSGALAGKTVAIKDNTAVAGIPMMNGSRTLEGFVPSEDATVVTRLLEAGAEITGKAVCEDLCFSGGSHTPATGPVRNPWDPSRSTGGSSGGSAALVAAGEVDLAIGGDQGGSIRIPSCWCGTVGLKATHGLVPYTGAFPIELTLDHLGPIGRTVTDVAAMLTAIAGPDGHDPRQVGVRVDDYMAHLDDGVEGLRIGIVPEGFGWDGLSEPDVDEAVRLSVERLADAGAKVVEVGVPAHREGIHIWNVIAIEGATNQMVNLNGYGLNWKGRYDPGMMEWFARGKVEHANDLSDTVKLVAMLGQYLLDTTGGRWYATARNLAPGLAAAYDDALSEVDLLAMPTLPLKPTLIPPADAPREERVARALEMIPNTAPFDVTGHPAVSLPADLVDGLPVGVMLIGRHWEEATVLRAARAHERLAGDDGYPRPPSPA
jgi:amidase